MIKRTITNIITKRLNKGKAIIILGARQTGKTTLIKSLFGELDNEVLFLNCDEPHVRTSLTNVSSSFLKQLIGNAKYILIDEAQRIKNIGITLKLITDELSEKQLIVTGSSSFDLVNEINEPLTGRKFEYFLFPVSWSELVEYRGMIQTMGELERRLVFGNYPDVINNPGNEIEILNNLTSSYLYKDLLSYKGIRKPDLLEKLLTALAFQVGNEVSYNEISNMLQVDKETISDYIYLLEQAFIVFKLSPFSRNLKNELTKKRKIYFYDNGIRNALISNYNPVELRQDIGQLWENFLISERFKINHYQFRYVNNYFWRTHQQQEIDYIEEYGGKLHAYEFKWKTGKKYRFPKTFLNTYPDSETKIITTENYFDFILN
ncbi:MAG: ATP-binding protein [Bacteroidales bacterium]|nr:ATP-binding protein [Bacteroidales bacterium]